MSAHLDIDLGTAEEVDVALAPASLDIGVDLPSVDIGVPGLTGPPGATGGTGIEIVNHNTDPNYPRPDVPIAYWVGSVVPVNALPTDFYTSP